jgi:hypothetical protein
LLIFKVYCISETNFLYNEIMKNSYLCKVYIFLKSLLEFVLRNG